MTIQARHLGSRLLLILALAAALPAGLVAVQLATGHNSLSQTFITKLGNDSGGGHIHSIGKVGGDFGGGRYREAKLGGDQGGGR